LTKIFRGKTGRPIPFKALHFNHKGTPVTPNQPLPNFRITLYLTQNLLQLSFKQMLGIPFKLPKPGTRLIERARRPGPGVSIAMGGGRLTSEQSADFPWIEIFSRDPQCHTHGFVMMFHPFRRHLPSLAEAFPAFVFLAGERGRFHSWSMNWSLRLWLSVSLACLTLLFVGGCKSKPSTVQWDNRVGLYTYDMAVDEFGSPNNEAVLGDGTQLCQWLIRRRSSSTYKILYGSWLDDGEEKMDEFLTLSFDSKGVLRGWKTVYK